MSTVNVYMIMVTLLVERTEKVNMASIKNVVSEAMEGNEEYHILVSITYIPTSSTKRYRRAEIFEVLNY